MKKFLKFFAVAALFSFGICSFSKAETCAYLTVDCGNGKGTYGLVCGESSQELIDDANFITDYTCK